jgi:hypothetical protein
MVIISPLWTTLCVTVGPGRDVHSVDRRTILVVVGHWLVGQEFPELVGVDPSLAQGGVEASPSAAMDAREAQVRRRRDVPGSQDRIEKLE